MAKLQVNYGAVRFDMNTNNNHHSNMSSQILRADMHVFSHETLCEFLITQLKPPYSLVALDHFRVPGWGQLSIWRGHIH